LLFFLSATLVGGLGFVLVSGLVFLPLRWHPSIAFVARLVWLF
jgi:hypothetical protein